MTASCSNSDGESGVTQSPVSSVAPNPVVNLRNGPIFVGEAPDDTLTTIATGDFNADGERDLALGAAFADSEEGADNGTVYVFYSVASLGADELSVSEADIVFHGGLGDQAGRSLAAADINGDRVDDLVIGGPAADAGDRVDAGIVYILLGNPVFHSVRSSSLPDNPSIVGADAGDFFGYTLATGDLNGDGLADLAMGAFLGDGPRNERHDSGELHILYGGNPPRNVSLADETLDATVYGPAMGDRFGEAITSGDFDGNGRDDLIVAATFADRDAAEDAGTAVILTSELRSVTDLAQSFAGTRILGIDGGDQLGHSLATLDFNADGFDDLLLGAVSADGRENETDLAGEVVLALGSADPPAEIDARDLPIMYGPPNGRLGRAVAAGDLDGDGLDDAILGASEAPDDQGTPETGAVFVAFGNTDAQFPGSTELAPLAIYGVAEGDNLITQVNGIPAMTAADLNRDHLDDLVLAAPRANAKRGVVTVYIVEAVR